MSTPIIVYFDGNCPYCRREVYWYQRWAEASAITWVNLAQGEEALTGESFRLEEAFRWLHVRDAEGNLRIGLDAHLVMWSALPGLNYLARLLRRCPKFIHTRIDQLYRWLTVWRPGYRKYRKSCEGACNA